MDAKLNQFASVDDFRKAYILCQYPHEDKFRAASYEEFYNWLNVRLELSGIEMAPVQGGASEEEATVIPAGPAGQRRKMDASPGWYSVGGVPVEATKGSIWKWFWNGTSWSLVDMGKIDIGKLDSGGYIGTGSDLDKRLQFLENGEIFTYPEELFFVNIPGSIGAAGYRRTELINMQGIKYACILFQGVGSVNSEAIRFFDKDGGVVHTVGFRNDVLTSRLSQDQQFYFIEIEKNWAHMDVMTRTNISSSYKEWVSTLVVIGNSIENINNTIARYIIDKNQDIVFPEVGSPVTGILTYNSTHIMPFVPGMLFDYEVDALNGAGSWYNIKTGQKSNIIINNGKFLSTDYGLIAFSTYNDSHNNFDPDFLPKVEIAINGATDENADKPINVSGSYLPTLSLKAVREVSFLDGSQRMAIQYLWHDNDLNFYISSTIRGDKRYLFKYDKSIFYGELPHMFSMGFDNVGNIVCVFRTEALSSSIRSDSVRKQPIILVKDDNYKPVFVNFGESELKPSGWLQNCGFLATEEAIFITEYTRPSVETANTWKVTYPVTDKSNWKTVQSFIVDSSQSGFKHIHNVDRDPYTGIIYTSTGDLDVAAAIYYSLDKGDTFSTLLAVSEKYARVLNWVFTKDWVYWATDSTGLKHWFFRAPRKPDGTIDSSNIEDVIMFPSISRATYATIYMPKINILVFLGRADGAANELPIDIYDLENSEFRTIDILRPLNNEAKIFGFRCETFEYVPRGNDIPCGFSRKLGLGGYLNTIGILGNTSEDTKKVNNIVITIDRVGNNQFTVNYSSEVL